MEKRLRVLGIVLCAVVSGLIFPAACQANDGQLLYVSRAGGEPLTVYERVNGRERRVMEIPANQAGEPGFLDASRTEHEIVIRGASGSEVRYELGLNSGTWRVPGQSDEAFFVCLGYRNTYAGRDPRRNPKYDDAPWLTKIRPVSFLALVGMVGWGFTLRKWLKRHL